MRVTGRLLLLLTILLAPAVALAGDFPKGQPPVYVFTQDFCPACLGAEEYMKAHGIKYDKFNIDRDKAALKVFRKLGAKGTPFFIIGHQRVAGFDPREFKALFEKAKSAIQGPD